MNRGRSYLTSVGFMAAGLSLIAPAVAQEVGGLTAILGVKQSIESSDNFDLTDPASSGARALTQLTFGLTSQTSTSQLALNLGGNLEFGETDESGFTDPSASLSYMQSSRNSQLMLQASYAETDVNALTTVFADNSSFGLDEQLVVGSGTRERTGARFRFETGMDAPLGLILDGRYSGIDFDDTTDPDLFKTERLTFGATVRVRVNSAVTMRFGIELEDYDSQDASSTGREDSRVFWESDFDIRSDLSATTKLSFSRNETTTRIVNTGFGAPIINNTQVDEGFGGGFEITKTLANGTVGANFETRVTSDGRRDTVRVTRVLDLPRGNFSFSLGAVKTDTSDVEPLVDMTYRQEMPRGLLTLGLRQQTSLSDDDDTTINTRLQASYNQEINSSSSWGLTALLADSDAIMIDDDSRRLDLGVDYRREITRDWDLVANYTYSTLEDSDTAQRTSNTFSLSIEKAFQFKP